MQRSFNLGHCDPLDLYLKLNPHGPGFLESCPPRSRIGRYSIVPLQIRDTFTLTDCGLLRQENGSTEQLAGDVFVRLAEILTARAIPDRPGLPPFCGGFFGYFGYDLSRDIEVLPLHAEHDLSLPRLWLSWVDTVACYDHLEKRLHLTSLDPQVDLDALKRRIRAAVAAPSLPTTAVDHPPLQPLISATAYADSVRHARDYIAAGDIYQANLSCRFSGPPIATPTDLYRALRSINPSPFACYLQTPQVTIISSSPERLVSLHDGVAETRPIAGTRPRGYTPPEDLRLGAELLGNAKECAEHVMLVDLERNDLGKVCRTGSVTVDELMTLERYSHVTHIVSNVRGELRPDCGPFDLLRATFPGGTITGVPKKRCMEIIEELEPAGRGVYTGSAGYIGANGRMDLNILIRTFQQTADQLSYQVGAGIVADSDPQREWDECLAKGRAMQLSLRGKTP
ncbi:MAG: anthranilate synthase component I family protein [Desulfuromonadales bacterium]|nr:anthranilate synthase component I family protein [Desulfuromonadales bacterium]